MKSLILSLSLIFLVSCATSNKSESTGQYIDSSAITAKVKTAFLRDKRLSSFNIKVNTYKNRVQLSGFVKTTKEKTVAGEVARKVSGVKAVENNIIVRSE